MSLKSCQIFFKSDKNALRFIPLLIKKGSKQRIGIKQLTGSGTYLSGIVIFSGTPNRLSIVLALTLGTAASLL